MKPDFTKLTQLIAARPDWNLSDQRNEKRRAADAAIGDEVERIVATFCQQYGFRAMNIAPFDFHGLSHPAGLYLWEDPEDGDLIQGHFVAFDMLICGTTSFLIEVKLKPFQRNKSERFYPLDRKRLRWMGKAYSHVSDLRHLFVILDPKRMEAPAHGLFVAPVDQLLANESDYQIQIGHAEPFYRIPISEFRPLSHFLEQHNQSKDTPHATPQKPFPCTHAAA